MSSNPSRPTKSVTNRKSRFAISNLRTKALAGFALLGLTAVLAFSTPASASQLYGAASLWGLTDYVASFFGAQNSGIGTTELKDENASPKRGRAAVQGVDERIDIEATIAQVTAIGKGVEGPRTNAVSSLTYNISPAIPPYSPTNNDYTVINDAIQLAAPGDIFNLSGTFDWTEPNAAARWALGSDNIAATGDDYSILIPANVNNVTFTAASLGAATIQGPGDLAGVNLEGVLYFDGSGDNQGWTMSNIRYFDFDLAIGMFNGPGGSDAYDNTQIVNNLIRIPDDLNATVAPADVNQNIGIHFSFGANQNISNNQFETSGAGVSDAPTSFSSVVGMQSNTSGGAVYDGLTISNNTFTVTGTQTANPSTVLAFWENAHGHSSDISVTGNTFTNTGVNNPALNLQRAFRVTSHSSASTTVTYSGNSASGANLAFQWIAGSNFSTNQPVAVTSNTITGNGTGFLVQSQGIGNFSFNRIVGNTTGANNVDGVATAQNNWWGCNAGPNNAGCDTTVGTVDSDPWLVLSTTTSDTLLKMGETASVTAGLTKNSDNATPIGGSVPDSTTISLTSTVGTFAPNCPTLTSGLCSSTFTAGAVSGNDPSATVDNETASFGITVDSTPPTVVSSQTVPPGGQTTNAVSLDFSVTFSEDVNGVDTGDFAITTTGSVVGAFVSGVTPVAGPEDVYTVTVSLGAGSNGTVRLDTIDNNTISDLAANFLGGPGAGNGGFNAGEIYTLDTTPPTVTINQAAGQTDPTAMQPINFTVVFDGPVVDFDDASDVALSGSAGGLGGASKVITGGPTTYNVAVSGLASDGTVTASIPANAAQDAATNDNTASTSSDNTVTLDTTVLVVDDDGFGSIADCNALTPPAFTSIQDAINTASPGAIIRVCPSVDVPEGSTDSYDEDVTVNKAVTIVGVDGAATTIVEGPIGGSGSTFTFAANNIDLSGFTITREGNNPGDWNNPGLNSGGISIQGLAQTGSVIHDNIVKNLRTGIDVNNSNGHTIRNNQINDNRTGLIFRNQTDSIVLTENEIKNNTTVGVLFLDASGGSNSPVQTALNWNASNNDISGNWYGQVVDRQTGGSLPAPGTTNLKNFSGNWYGTTTPVVTTANSAEPGYAAQIPVWAGGTATAPVGQPDIAGAASANIDYSPYLNSGTDTSPTFGFQGDFTNIWAAAASKQANPPAPAGNINEAVDVVTSGGTINATAGTYVENVNVDKPVTVLGPNFAVDPNVGPRVAEAVIYPAISNPSSGVCSYLASSSIVALAADGVTFKGFTLDGNNPGLTSGYIFNAQDIDAYVGVSGPGSKEPQANVGYNIVKNLGEFGIDIYGNYDAGARTTKSTVSNNLVDNVVGLCYGFALSASANAPTDIQNNVVTRSFLGASVQDFNTLAGAFPNSTVGGNSINVYGYGVWTNLLYGYSTGTISVSGNSITSYAQTDIGTLQSATRATKSGDTKDPMIKRATRFGNENSQDSVGGWGKYIGVKIESVNGSVPVAITNNTIAINRAALLGDTPPYTMIDGIRLTNPSNTSTAITITGNSVSNANNGLVHTAPNVPSVTCNNFFNNDIGVYIGTGLDYDNNSESALNGIALNNNNILGNSLFGVKADTGTALVNNATANYWGAASGPGGAGPGTGDDVSALVNFSGFLAASTVCGPTAPPTVTIDQASGQADPANANPVHFTAVFSEAVTGFATGDVVLSGTVGGSVSAVNEIAPMDGTTYDVVVNGLVTGETVVATISSGAATAVAAPAGRLSIASTSMDNSVYYDDTVPTAIVSTTAGAYTNASGSPIPFTVVFSEAVTGFGAGSMTIVNGTAGTITGPTGCCTYTFAVTPSGEGTVSVTVNAGAVTDAALNPNPVSNTASTIYDSVSPTVTIDKRTSPAQADPTSSSPIHFTAEFTDANAVTGFTNADVVVQTDTTQACTGCTAFSVFATPTVVVTSTGPLTYNVAVSGMNQGAPVVGNPVTVSISANAAVDAAGNNSAASTSPVDGTVAFILSNTNILVTPDNMMGWVFGQENAGVASGTLVTGPATAPLGTGSARLAVDAAAGMAFGKGGYSGVRLADITALSYSAYQTSGANPSVHITVAFDVDSDVTDLNNAYQGRIVYEPYNDPANTFTAATWHNFDAMSPTARFYGSNGGGTRPLTVACPPTSPCTRSQILTLFPNLGVRNSPNGVIVFKAGSGAAPGLDGNVDNLVVGVNSVNETYNFDETPPTVAISDVTVIETQGTQMANFTITRTGASTLAVTGVLNTADGTATVGDSDYVAGVNVPFTIPASVAVTDSTTVSITVNGDSSVEGNEAFTAVISGVANAAVTDDTGTGTINNNDVEISFDAGALTTPESGSATITVNRNGVTANAATFDYTTTAGTAPAANAGPGSSPSNPIDFTAAANQPLSIAGNATTTTFNVPIGSDLISEVNENIAMTLSNAGGGDNVMFIGSNPKTLTITDDDGGGLINISGNVTAFTGGAGIVGVTMTLIDGVNPPVVTTTGAGGAYTFTGLPSGGSYNITPTCPVNPTCVDFEVFDASAREYVNQFMSVTGASFEGYNGDNPRDVTFVTTTQPTFGSATTVPITMVSRGTENSMTFRLTYDPSKLVFQSAACGVDAPVICTVTPASGPAPIPGSLTLVLDLDPGVTFAAGLKQAMTVTFGQGPSVTAADYNAPVTFAATPRAIGNTSGLSVPADYFSGLVLFAQGKEGDIHDTVTPGYPDGFIDGFDVARIRSLSANNALVNNSINEFQRADCNVYVARGDGYIDGLDITQVRRYISLDPHQLAGGPTVPAPFAPLSQGGGKTVDGRSDSLAPHDVRIVSRAAGLGQTIQVKVELDTAGDENVVQFSIEFDPTRLSMSTMNGITKGPDAPLGSDFLDPVYSTNGQDVNAGRVGAILSRAPGTTFMPAGTTKQVVLLTFTVNPMAPLGPTPVTFRTGMGFSPRNLLGDVNAVAIPGANFVDGQVNIQLLSAANTSVAGHVANASGTSVNRARVTLTGSDGSVRTSITNGLGNFVISDVPAGTTYVVSVSAKGYTFTPRTIAVDDQLSKLELVLDN